MGGVDVADPFFFHHNLDVLSVQARAVLSWIPYHWAMHIWCNMLTAGSMSLLVT